MYNPLKKVNPDSLEAALQACSVANKQGYAEAKVYLKGLKKSIDDASAKIKECIEGMKKYHINDESLVQNIRSQLQTVQKDFEQSYYDTQKSLSNKSKMSAMFNITLFGKTKAGKSTLMEILTHGDGSHMGKGGQRTTRDVRSYEWRGMAVTDVPGIDAYGGQEDDEKAEEAATYADLILFMITAGQPEGSEADWMVKLKKMDKPMLCVCNYKQSIGEGIDDFRLKRLLSNPKKLEERMNIGELVSQFNTFLNEQLPDERVDFKVTHLLAKFYSQQPEYESKKAELEKVSRFSYVEQSLINEVNTNGVLHRKKCYLSIIDAPLYQQMNQLFAFSAEAYSQFRIIQDKVSLYEDWCETFNERQKNNIVNVITEEYNKLRNSIPDFVERHLEDNDVDNAWKIHCEGFNTQYNIEKCIESIKAKLEKKTTGIFSELETEMNFSFKFKGENGLGNYQFINWKKYIKWVGTISSASLGIASIILSSTPLGLAALSAAIISKGISWFFDSREDKLRERRSKLSKKLNDIINKEEEKSQRNILQWYDKEITPQEHNISNRLDFVGESLFSLSNSERQLALGYSKNHKDITKMIITNIFYAMNVPKHEVDRIVCAARVPGRRIAIIIKGRDNLPIKLNELASRLGNNEVINIIKLDTSKPIKAQFVYLLKYFDFVEKPSYTQVDDDTQIVVYPYNKYMQKDLDSLNLIQQIMNVHIILK